MWPAFYPPSKWAKPAYNHNEDQINFTDSQFSKYLARFGGYSVSAQISSSSRGTAMSPEVTYYASFLQGIQ